MCGIAGYLLSKSQELSHQRANQLLHSISHRGPDDQGVCLISRPRGTHQFYSTDKTGQPIKGLLPHFESQNAVFSHDIALFHTRFSIIDLSDGGHQPFISHDQSIIAIFNGEIYNYIELKEELLGLGVQFHTQSDTEVLVEGYAYFREKLWPKLNGFWAIALYDFAKKEFILSRDRIGVAPLYYREHKSSIYFASTIQALIDIDPETIDRNDDVLFGFLQTGIKDHDCSTYYSQIKSVPQASYVAFKQNQHRYQDALCKKYWDLPSQRLSVKDISFDEALKQYREHFFNAVKIRLRSDVKVAFELSGGLDSSSVVAAACLMNKDPITTYTVKIKGADEEPFARSILKKYKVDYHVISEMEDNFANDYEKFSKLMEEPFDNPNAYTHHMMLQHMKNEGVNVVVTGAGGDEVLAGYEASFWPKAYHELKSTGLNGYIYADWYEFCRRFKTIQSASETLKHYVVDSLKLLAQRNNHKNTQANLDIVTQALKYQSEYRKLTFHEQTQFHFNVALVPFYMRSSDHFTMSIPVEHRFPFLDYRMVELGLKLPISYLFNGGWTKYILRKAMEPYLPRTIIWRRKKMGFDFPFRQYFSSQREQFKPLINELSGVLNPSSPLTDYETLLKSDAVLLWRVLSTAVWFKQNFK